MTKYHCWSQEREGKVGQEELGACPKEQGEMKEVWGLWLLSKPGSYRRGAGDIGNAVPETAGRTEKSAFNRHQPGLVLRVGGHKGWEMRPQGHRASPAVSLQWVTLSCRKAHFC